MLVANNRGMIFHTVFDKAGVKKRSIVLPCKRMEPGIRIKT